MRTFSHITGLFPVAHMSNDVGNLAISLPLPSLYYHRLLHRTLSPLHLPSVNFQYRISQMPESNAFHAQQKAAHDKKKKCLPSRNTICKNGNADENWPYECCVHSCEFRELNSHNQRENGDNRRKNNNNMNANTAKHKEQRLS